MNKTRKAVSFLKAFLYKNNVSYLSPGQSSVWHASQTVLKYDSPRGANPPVISNFEIDTFFNFKVFKFCFFMVCNFKLVYEITKALNL